MDDLRCPECNKLLMKDRSIKCMRCKTIVDFNNGITVTVNNKEINKIIDYINWDNFQDKDGEYWTIRQVLHSKLEFLKDNLRTLAAQGDGDEDIEFREASDTIELTQKYLASMNLYNKEGVAL